ncbi:DUF2635 domain-containing protein [Pseudomonas sp. MPB23]|uniref:DUF2635 domain-containing protein n=1 Tax=Pseudomonas sp. MPB23 TaxID=3388490 RepID=UPI00398481AE
MTKRITVVPAKGRSVPDPEAGDLLPVEGRDVPDNVWWRRRQADGDVKSKDVEPTTTKAAVAAKTEVAK